VKKLMHGLKVWASEFAARIRHGITATSFASFCCKLVSCKKVAGQEFLYCSVSCVINKI
jgi:hypothetical protein